MSKHKKQARKKLSIIIPFYGQTEADLAIPLSSINNQVGVDFSKLDVHLVNDGGAPIDLEKFEIFAHLDLQYHELPENVGPGMARQHGIDQSEGAYLMFVDADDELSEAGTLFHFFEALKKTGDHEMIWANFVEAGTLPNFGYIIHTNDAAFLFGKWFSRSYLKRIGLRFQPELRLYEDVYFTRCATILAKDVIQLGTMAYVWRYRKDSLTKANNRAMEKQGDVIAIEGRLQAEFLAQHRPQERREILMDVVVNTFLFYEKFYPMADETAFKREFHKLLDTFSDVWEGYTPQLQLKTSMAARSSFYQGVNPDRLKDFLEKFDQKTAKNSGKI